MIHDHLDGSANCIECQGRCKLEGAELRLTQIARVYVESRNLGAPPTWWLVEKILTFYGHGGIPGTDLRRLEAAELEIDPERGPRIKQEGC